MSREDIALCPGHVYEYLRSKKLPFRVKLKGIFDRLDRPFMDDENVI